MLKFLNKFFDSNEKQLQKIQPIVEQINELEDEYSQLSNKQLEGKTEEFRKKLNIDLTKSRTDFTTLNKEQLKQVLEEEKSVSYFRISTS